MTISPTTVESIADAIGRPSRRTVAKGAAWSVPAIAVGIAAPAEAASPPVCPSCSAGVAPRCLIRVPNNGGTCTCGPGLACVGTGPLGLANVCVGQALAPLLVTCGGTQCTGVCLTAGGAVVTAVNTLVATLTTATITLRLVPGFGDTFRECNRLSNALPTNICVSPFNGGGLGSICVETFTCSGNPNSPIGAVTTIVTAVNTLITTLSTLGIAVSSQCGAGLVCRGGPSLALDNDSSNQNRRFGVSVNVGICQCGTRDVCPDVASPPFTVAC